MKMNYLFLFGLIAVCSSYIIPDDQYQEYRIIGDYDLANFEPIEVEDHHIRLRRSFAPGAPTFPMPGQHYPSSVGAKVDKVGQDTVATINAAHQTDRTKVTGTWSKVVRGPNKAKPSWGIGVQHRW